MKKALLFLLIILSSSVSLSAETTIRITNGEWEPYMSEYSPYYGFVSHVVYEAFKSEDINVKWRFFPWKRSLIVARKGKYFDASCCWWPSEEIEENFLISDPITKSSVVFFHLQNYKFDWSNMDDLKGIRIGGTFEYEYSKEFMTAMKDKSIIVDTVPTDEQNFKKLLGGRIDVFPNDPIVGYSQIRNTFSPSKVKLFTHHPKELQSTSLNLIISKECPQSEFFMTKFNLGLKKLASSGRLGQMFSDVMTGKYDKQKIKWKEKKKRKIRALEELQ